MHTFKFPCTIYWWVIYGIMSPDITPTGGLVEGILPKWTFLAIWGWLKILNHTFIYRRIKRQINKIQLIISVVEIHGKSFQKSQRQIDHRCIHPTSSNITCHHTVGPWTWPCWTFEVKFAELAQEWFQGEKSRWEDGKIQVKMRGK